MRRSRWPAGAKLAKRPRKKIARDQHGRILDPSEHVIQMRLVSALAYMLRPEIFFFAVPNQSNRRIANAVKMKSEGLKSGVSDLVFLFPTDEGVIGWLEMKRPGETLSKTQEDFRDVCLRLGHRWAMACSVEEAIEVLHGWGALRADVQII